MLEEILPDINKTTPAGALIVSAVDPASPAERAGVRTGDCLLEVNGHGILDILDYRYHADETRLRLKIARDGEEKILRLKRDEAEDIGIDFISDLGDKIHTCVNKCVFCFIHQMPHKMRKTLYLMDDDFRLSFMHGAYVTLTNLREEEWERIIQQRLSPLYVSVHATDPELRGRLLGKKNPEPIIPNLERLADNRIDVHAQVVLCPGLNDGSNLHRTLEELSALHPAQSGKRAGVQSVAIVPVGLTRYRERLTALTTADRDFARDMIKFVKKEENHFTTLLGTRFAWLSDEWYFLAEQPMPGAAHYEEFPQLEDGVGTVRLFLEDARRLEKKLPARVTTSVKATLVTAELAAEVVKGFAERLNRIDGVDLNVMVLRNEFFGGGINIAGLMTGQDICAQLKNFNAHETVYIPSICLRDGSQFLDDWTLEDLRRETGRDIQVCGIRPDDLVEKLLIS